MKHSDLQAPFQHQRFEDCWRYVVEHTKAMRNSVLIFLKRRKTAARALFLFALSLSVAKSVAAEDALALFPIRQNGKFGYINAAGEVVIAPQFLRNGFEGAKPFAEGLQPVWVGEETGYVNASGKMVIEPKFGQAQAFPKGSPPFVPAKLRGNGVTSTRREPSPFTRSLMRRTSSPPGSRKSLLPARRDISITPVSSSSRLNIAPILRSTRHLPRDWPAWR
ncbi:MAG TPA: WG repeat-containing protein [Chthoniobacteraceae bacterium]